MNRRSLFKAALATGAGTMAGVRGAAASATTEAVPRVVYHLSDSDKVSFVLGNVRNHIEGMGGSDRVHIAVVVHGPSLRAFRASTASAAVRVDTDRLVAEDVALFACRHTLESLQMTPATLLPGFAVADTGGVVKLAELQGQGWIYLRP